MKKLRKAVSVLICICMVFGSMPPVAEAYNFDENYTEEKKTIVTDNGTKLVLQKKVDYHTEEIAYKVLRIEDGKKDVYIPETVDGMYPITEIDLLEGFDHKTQNKVKHLHLSKNIQDINEESVDYDYYDEKTNIYFWLPNLSSITIDSENPWLRAQDGKVYRKKDNALLAVAPKVPGVIVIEKDVPEIIGNATISLEKATAFSVEKGNPAYQSKKGVLYSKDGKTLIRYPIAGKAKKFQVPKGVKYIGPQAFQYAKYLNNVHFSSSVREVGERAFAASSLKEIALNKKMRKLETDVFLGAKGLKSLKLPSGLREAEISYIPVKKLVIPARLGSVTIDPGVDLDNYHLEADTLVIKNPALDIKRIGDSYRQKYWADFLEDKTVYAYKGSLPYRQLKKYKKKYKAEFKLKALKGKVYKTPKFTGKVDTSWYSEDKTTFYISTPAQLAGMSQLSRKKDVFFNEKTIILTKNLDMKKYKNFYPIEFFMGTFDGNGKTIKNLRIYRLQENVGLFDRLEGSIKNLSVQGNVTGGNYTGGIAGYVFYNDNKRLINCSFKGKVFGYGYCGKLAGTDITGS